MIAKCIVTGNLQGVQFRETIARIADKAGLKGKAKNLPDGGVELLFILNNEADKNKIKQCIELALEKTEETGLLEADEIGSIRINDVSTDSS